MMFPTGSRRQYSRTPICAYSDFFARASRAEVDADAKSSTKSGALPSSQVL